MTHAYASPEYAAALSHWGRPISVPEWGTSLILRTAAEGAEDAFGPYPLCVLGRDSDLVGGLQRLTALGAIAVTLVVDDVHRPEFGRLEDAFDFVRPFKSHLVRRRDLPFTCSKHHRYEVRRARRRLDLRVFDLAGCLDAWTGLYDALRRRHSLTGVHDFPRSYFSALAGLQGLVALGAWQDETLLSAHLWMAHEGHVISHLAATSPEGYRQGAAYAVHDAAIEHFRDADVINFGGSAGHPSDESDGLWRFKRGFANDTAPAFLCGKVLDPRRYTELCKRVGAASGTDYFPAYRQQGATNASRG